MASPASLINSLIAVMQTVGDLLTSPFTFTTTEAASLSTAIEALRGGIQALPINALKKADLLNRLDAAQAILADFIAGTTLLSPVEVLLAVASELEVLKQKILALNLQPCAGTVTVCLPSPFNTLCVCN
ncbi:MAG: hypothetical protein K6U03_05900 [Firmicutes bacterium]|nr:hypothetical protein [Bacillota bacterium]